MVVKSMADLGASLVEGGKVVGIDAKFPIDMGEKCFFPFRKRKELVRGYMDSKRLAATKEIEVSAPINWINLQNFAELMSENVKTSLSSLLRFLHVNRVDLFGRHEY